MSIFWPNGSTTPPNFSAEGHFGYRNSNAPNASKYHRGLDMWGIGDVRAIAGGTVVAVGWGAGYGWGGGYQVWIQHDGFFTRTLHLVDGSARVGIGERVTAGQSIGTEGMTGAYQVHVHLEITLGQWHTANTGQIDPKAWLLEHVTASGSSGITASKGNPMETYILRNDGTVFHIIAGIQCYQFTSVKDYNDWKGVVDTQRKQGATNLISPPRLGKLKKMPAWRVDALRKRYGV